MKKRKGLSSLIAASFLIIILFTSLAILFEFNRKTSEVNNIITEMNIYNYERSHEDYSIIGVPFNPSNELDISVRNDGEVAISLKWMQVLNAKTLEPVLRYIKIDEELLPGETRNSIGSHLSTTFPGAYEGSTSYIIQILSERGTTTSYLFPPIEREYQVVTNKYYSGPFEFNLDSSSFRYTSKDIDGSSRNERQYNDNPIASVPAFQMNDFYDNIVYEIKLKNVNNRTVEIQASTFFLVIVPQIDGTGETELYNYIVSQESNSNELIGYASDYSQSIESGESSVLKFGSRYPRGDTFLYPNSLRGYQGNERGSENLLTTYLIIFWRFQDTTSSFGQTIPLGSILVEGY